MLFNLSIPTLISRIITLLIAFTFHEFAHAAVATALGDPTPKLHGRLTLNPLAHLDVLGTVTLLFAGFGWAKPVPVSPAAVLRKCRAGMVLVSLAGPAANLVLGALAALPLRFGWVPMPLGNSTIFPSLRDFLIEFLVINLSLFLFNLIPMAPLDGEKIFIFFLPEHWVRAYERIRPYSPYILLLVVVILPRLGVDVINIIMGEPLLNLAVFLVGGS